MEKEDGNLNLMGSPSTPVKTWFETEVLWPRTISSLARGVILQFIALFVLASLQSFNPLHPLSWLTDNVTLLISPSSWFYDFAAIAAISGLGLLYTKQFRLSTWIPDTRLAVLSRFVEPSTATSLLVHTFAGGVLFRCYLGLLGGQFNHLTVDCSKDSKRVIQCLNSPHVFLVLSGCHAGLTLWWDFHFKDGNVIQFPIIEQSGNAQLSRKLFGLVKDSVTSVLLNLQWFYGLYIFFFGSSLESTLSELLRINLYKSTSLWNHLMVFWQCLLLSSLVTFTIKLLRTVISIDFTKPVLFPTLGDKSLSKALISDCDLLKHLAYYDFSKMASSSFQRRAEYFVLSQPGGHPHNWNEISDKCLAVLDDFGKRLNEALPNARQPVQPAKEEPAAPVLFSTTNNNARPLATKAKPESKKDNNKDGATNSGVQELMLQKARASFPVKLFNQAVDKLNKNALFNTAPDAKARCVCAQSQIIIWAVEGLSHLITASIDEDRFGVVQKDLSKVIIALLTLQQTVERHKGVTVTAKKNRFEPFLQLKQELRVAIKSSLYRITVAFGDHLNSVALPLEYQKRISNYQNFLEG